MHCIRNPRPGTLHQASSSLRNSVRLRQPNIIVRVVIRKRRSGRSRLCGGARSSILVSTVVPHRASVLVNLRLSAALGYEITADPHSSTSSHVSHQEEVSSYICRKRPICTMVYLSILLSEFF